MELYCYYVYSKHLTLNTLAGLTAAWHATFMQTYHVKIPWQTSLLDTPSRLILSSHLQVLKDFWGVSPLLGSQKAISEYCAWQMSKTSPRKGCFMAKSRIIQQTFEEIHSFTIFTDAEIPHPIVNSKPSKEHFHKHVPGSMAWSCWIIQWRVCRPLCPDPKTRYHMVPPKLDGFTILQYVF